MVTSWSLNVLWNYNRIPPSLNVHPNLLDHCSHSFGILIQHSIECFYLAIQLWAKCRVKRQFRPHLLKQCFQKLGINLASLSLTMIWSIPWCLTHISNNNLVESKVVAIVFVGTIFTNLKNWLTIIKMVYFPFHSKNWVMKSIETLSHSSLRIDRSL
jgi:hypothetical protein